MLRLRRAGLSLAPNLTEKRRPFAPSLAATATVFIALSRRRLIRTVYLLPAFTL